MNTTKLISEIAKKSGETLVSTRRTVGAISEVIQEAMKAGDEIHLLGVGSLKVVERKERQGFNPATKEKITIAAHKVVKFKAAKGLV